CPRNWRSRRAMRGQPAWPPIVRCRASAVSGSKHHFLKDKFHCNFRGGAIANKKLLMSSFAAGLAGQSSQGAISSAIPHLLHLRRRNSRMSWLAAGWTRRKGRGEIRWTSSPGLCKGAHLLEWRTDTHELQRQREHRAGHLGLLSFLAAIPMPK